MTDNTNNNLTLDEKVEVINNFYSLVQSNLKEHPELSSGMSEKDRNYIEFFSLSQSRNYIKNLLLSDEIFKEKFSDHEIETLRISIEAYNICDDKDLKQDHLNIITNIGKREITRYLDSKDLKKKFQNQYTSSNKVYINQDEGRGRNK